MTRDEERLLLNTQITISLLLGILGKNDSLIQIKDAVFRKEDQEIIKCNQLILCHAMWGDTN